MFTSLRLRPLRSLAIILLALAVGSPALAQDNAGAGAGTVLRLSVVGSVQVAPDQLVAEMVAQSTLPSPAAAQRRVNDLMARAMRTAQGVNGVEARAVGYAVTPVDEKRTSWTAQQTLELRADDGAALLDLVGKVQEQGLAAASLEWRVSPARWRKAHDEAETAALKSLQSQAAAAAATLGLRLDHIREIQLEAPTFLRRTPRPVNAMAMSSRAPPPQASASPEEVTATAAAEILLRP